MRPLDDPITMLTGAGEKGAASLTSLGIQTIEDLLTYYPFRCGSVQERNLNETQDQERITLKGIIVSPPVMNWFGYKESWLQFHMTQEHDVFNVPFSNRPYSKGKVTLSEKIAAYSKWDTKRKALNRVKALGSQTMDDFSPTYHVNKLVCQTTLADPVKKGFQEYSTSIEENLSSNPVERYRLLDRASTAKGMHFPKNYEENHQAKRRIAFGEFFLL